MRTRLEAALKPSRWIIVPVILLALAVQSAKAQTTYEWSISASSTDPFVHTAPIPVMIATYYLWYVCHNPGQVAGISTAEFRIESSGVVHVGTIPRDGFLNAGSTADLILAVAACPAGPILAADLLVLGVGLPGAMALAPRDPWIEPVAADCEQPVPEVWPIVWKGIGVGGAEPPGRDVQGSCGLIGHCPHILCDASGSCFDIDCWPECDCEFENEVESCDECHPTPVNELSWGQVKSDYR